MGTSLDDILDGGVSSPKPVSQSADPVQSEQSEPTESVGSQAEAEDTTGVTEQASLHAAPPAATVDEPLDKKISAFQRKAEDETRKRQDYERQVLDRDARLAAAERAIQERDAYINQHLAAQKQQQDELDIYDPQQLQKYIQSAVAQQAQGLQADFVTQKIVSSQEFMRSRHEDYSEVETVFAEEMSAREAQGDFSLRQRMEADPFPAKFAYDHAKRAKAMREIGDDPLAYKERLRQEWLAEQQTGQQLETVAPVSVQTSAKPVPQPPKSLASVPSAARNVSKQPWKGPTPLDQLLG